MVGSGFLNGQLFENLVNEVHSVMKVLFEPVMEIHSWILAVRLVGIEDVLVDCGDVTLAVDEVHSGVFDEFLVWVVTESEVWSGMLFAFVQVSMFVEVLSDILVGIFVEVVEFVHFGVLAEVSVFDFV